MPTTAHYFLEALQECGIEYLFCNLGTDHAPIVEELARWRAQGRTAPQVVLCPHETVAMHMAMGYAMVTGRGQAVVVHVDAGTANAVMGLHNCTRSRVPVLLIAGKAPFTVRGELPGTRDTPINFLQEPFDMAGLVRPYVKWSYDLPSGLVVKEALRRAHSVIHSEPRGPAYFTVAREILAEEIAADRVAAFPAERFGPVPAPGADDETLGELAARLLAARAPMLVSAYAGRHPETPALIDRLARFCGMGVYESNPIQLNIPRDSPCFCGVLPTAAVADADFGLLVDVDVPWLPNQANENPGACWAHIDIDPIKKDSPIWGFPTHLRIAGDSRRILERLLALLEARATPAYRTAAAARLDALAQARATRDRARAEAAAVPGEPGRINPAYMLAELDRVMEDDDILVQEAITNAPLVLEQLRRTRPLTLLGNGGGGLGFGAGTALGAKLARPERTVFHVSGDASFVFSAPTAAYMVAREHRLPIFSIVLDNCGWGGVKGATLRVYPDGEAKAAGKFQAYLGAGTRYDKVGEAAGAYGECVEDPADVRDAIARCLAEVKGGRAAVLVCRIAPVEQPGDQPGSH